MGAWGAGIFDNDDAVDWLADLSVSRDPNALDAALSAAAAEYVEAPDASVALAAAEVVAALNNRPAADLPGEIEEWIAGAGPLPSPELTGRAHAAVERVRTDSELKELWEETDPTEWFSHLNDLLRRLS
ncbi:MAG TPA: DUF4259 domain-containing protein [Longimicrobium sp.]|jgi:hypothetical protein|uniref:DUF4259 domain-containing protein n=1 Tax=Longimicrobium sp. TaxID=2029185 RepID=UPI002ED86A64